MPYFSKFSATWAASSRVGSRISERGMRARARPWREDVDHRQDEAGGLAGAGLGDADDVAPISTEGIAWRWIGVGVVIARLAHGAEQFV